MAKLQLCTGHCFYLIKRKRSRKVRLSLSFFVFLAFPLLETSSGQDPLGKFPFQEGFMKLQETNEVIWIRECCVCCFEETMQTLSNKCRDSRALWNFLSRDFVGHLQVLNQRDILEQAVWWEPCSREQTCTLEFPSASLCIGTPASIT